MHFSVILRILGLLLMLFSISMLPPLLIGWIYNDTHLEAFGYAFVITLVTGFIIWAPVYRVRQELRTRDGFLVTVLFWAVLSGFGSLPFMLHENPAINVVDAVFESMSGLTTTGATVLTNIDELPKSILFYRQQLQWLGGMGIIVLAVAILPMLGIGGMQLYRAETPGPVKDAKLTPRITETAKALWYLYLSLTTACAVAYWAAGMDLFDAVSHSFSTIAIGGFSTHDASIGYFNSPTIDAIAVVFMLIAGINFSLHFFAWRHRQLGHYLHDPEVVAYFVILGGVSLIAVLVLSISGTYGFGESIQYGIFEVVSIATTTGFSTTDFSVWPTFLAYLLFLTSFAGACAGSTGGGMKVIRVLLIYRQGVREITRMLHPNAVIPIKLGRKAVPDRVGEAVWGFFSAYVFIFILLFLALIATGLDLPTAFSTVASCMNNLGPALGDASMTYAELPDSSKWILSFAMLLGRLEIFTLLVLFTPMFWRR
ncbi:TrkH family potassium uptake protein [Aestuariirhabdus sp. Z084]|uniref:TrkH family potassium uptake protein n=1 Tax=Aestuariirhabdus haliotis TaxID=2918751 RepID=UPI00201B4480|nr:TrkH family potassium uptake protein [Aestuariirhabdus haliotis]MCL6414254.1 TrkH family potassium uptake protein [Aestuariirhabdus haliotis]MCL6418186.1 TrkH family potassium uptake protein [Aestuariirhabdus haliotis]